MRAIAYGCGGQASDDRFNTVFAVQGHTAPQKGSACVANHSRAPRNHFSIAQCSPMHSKGFTGKPLPHSNPFLACSIPGLVSDRAYLGSFRTDSLRA
ncbi:hypothetical protein TNCV_3999831 [Trichonephila clavipes]|nr:hypothetical protein TNCV_3999831 [Trichonephila clavipes]